MCLRFIVTDVRTFFPEDWFSDSVHKYFSNQTALDLRKKKLGFLNRDLPVM